jgi:hypothetical protein
MTGRAPSGAARTLRRQSRRAREQGTQSARPAGTKICALHAAWNG